MDWAKTGEFLLQGLTLLFMLVGLFGSLIPIIPGIPIIWLAALLYALISAYAGTITWAGWLLFGLITLLMIVGSLIDNIIISKKLRETGTPWKAIMLSYASGLIASLFLTPFAALFITPLALFALEYQRLRTAKPALKSVKGWLVGFGWTIAALFAIGCAMIGLWLLWIWL